MTANEKWLPEGKRRGIWQGRRIEVSAVFDCPPNLFWNKLLETSTLIEICNPMLSFKSVGKMPKQWQENKLYRFKIFLCRFLPLGIHAISVKSVDCESKSIQTEERNAFTTVWRHRITLSEINRKTLYTDSIELYAGIFSLAAALWGIRFYKHRHRRWKQLLKKTDKI